MNRRSIRPSQARRLAAITATLAIVLASCTSSTSTPTPGVTSPPASPPEALASVLASVAPTSSPTLAPTPSPTSSPSLAPTPEPSVTPSEAPTPSPTDTPTPPPTPFQFGDRDPATGLKLVGLDEGDSTATLPSHLHFTLTWQTPTSASTIVRVLGVTKCYAAETTTNRPCVRTTTHITASREVLIRKVLASARSTSWTWLGWEEIGEPIASDGPHDFYAIIVTFTTGATVNVVVVISSQTCSGCAY
jgi:hypothetical protein